MNRPAAGWRAVVAIRRPDAGSADRLVEVLAPEAEREVPRAVAALGRRGPRTIEITIRTDDTGALRAAVNAFLGWVELAVRSESVARRAVRDPQAKGATTDRVLLC